MDVFHSSAAAVGITRNGVMSSVRTMPRPKNCLSSSTARATPSTIDMTTAPTVSLTVLKTAFRNRSSVKTLP
jgi:hypothetical protein